MYLRDEQELEEILRLGLPKSWSETADVRQRHAEQRLRMPAYGERLSDAQIDDLVALVQAEEAFGLPEEDPTATTGRALARRLGCPSCHGAEGAGGHPNPGSLGGFIPGFLGRNFVDLVRNREEFFEWVRTGTSRRLEGNPVVQFFWARQAISMPAYGDSLTEDELQSLYMWTQSARNNFGASATLRTSR